MLIGLLALACAGGAAAPSGLAARGVSIAAAPPPSERERYCAWYGDAGDDGVLYFGQAAFWSAMADAGGDPLGDLRHPGPQLIGRFDLASERLLPPLRVDDPEGPPARSGVWDVLAIPGGRVVFTTFYDAAGVVDVATGRVTRLSPGGGLNELAPGPDGTVLATRYGSGSGDGGDGEVIALRADGTLAARWALFHEGGYRVAPKTPAWDPHRHELWLTTDLLPPAGSPTSENRHDALRIDLDGTLHALPEPPELQFVATGGDGTLYRAFAAGARLWLDVTPPPGAGVARKLALDEGFAAGLDFVQDIQPSADGRVVVTRWSGRIDVARPDGTLGSLQLPRPSGAGFYYTGVLHGDRLCATYCSDVRVVCADAP